MNISLMKYLGNMDQIAGIREYQLLRGRGQQMQVAEFYNAAGLRFTVVPDRGMDLYDFSYKGVNFSFHSKNGLTSPQAYSAAAGEFCEQWSGGMLATCGLDNVGGHCTGNANFPTHGRYANVPADTFGTEKVWEDGKYILRATGEMNQTRLYGRHLSVRRTVETELDGKTVKIRDRITNLDGEDQPYMLLYHFNFGYPLLQEDTLVRTTGSTVQALSERAEDTVHMTVPTDGIDEELFLIQGHGERGAGVIWNVRLELGAYVAFDTKNLPNMLQWKMMKSRDYVVGLEPCNTYGISRLQAIEQDKIAVLPAFSSVENCLELGVLDGMTEIQSFLKNL